MLTVGCDPSCTPLTVGTTACNNTPYQYPLTAEPVNGTTVVGTSVIVECPPVGAQSCIVDAWPWSQPCLCCGSAVSGVHMSTCPTLTLRTWPSVSPVTAPPRSDADIERIARRVVELLREERR